MWWWSSKPCNASYRYGSRCAGGCSGHERYFECRTFSAGRRGVFFCHAHCLLHGVAPHAQSNIAVGDTEVLQDLLSTIYQQPNAELWIWTSILPADVCMHHWIWQHANNCHEQIKVIPIGGLPFFGADGRLFFPERIVDILPAQLAKATKLARKQLPQEIAQYKEEWEALCKENMGMRVSQSNKTAISKPINHFDTQIAAYCTPELKKANKVVNTILHKTKLPLGDWVIAWRLRCMAAEGILHLEGTPEAGLTAWEICLAGDSLFALREGE